ncbi:MAG: hypothetical protein CME26_04675 [Gemmatimonadetes bacterium]|nr:hypothetical protein [Gemmatimonadota bacterium]
MSREESVSCFWTHEQGDGYRLSTPSSEPTSVSPVRSLLATGPFRWFLSSNATTGIGMELQVLAQSWLILELGGTQYDVGAAAGYRVVPAVLVSLAAGVLIDRLGGRAILLWDRLVLLALAAGTAALVLFGPIEVWHVIVLSVASGAVMGLGASSSRTLVSQIVTKVELQAANALSEFGMSVARAIGLLIGGLMVAAYGLGAPWVVLTGIRARGCAWQPPCRDARPRPLEGPLRWMADGWICGDCARRSTGRRHRAARCRVVSGPSGGRRPPSSGRHPSVRAVRPAPLHREHG